MRGVVVNTRAAILLVWARHRSGNNLPRCERLAGNASRTDGQPLSICACTDVANPVASCIHATRQLRRPYALTDTRFIFPVPLGDPDAQNGLNAGDISAIANVSDTLLKLAARGEDGEV